MIKLSKVLLSALFALQILYCPLISSRPVPQEIEGCVWAAVEPYLLPDDHKTWKFFDKLFSRYSFRVIESPESLKKAGFKETGTRHTQNFHVMKHKKLKGWLLKIYTDDAVGETDWQHFVYRCQGAQAARESIEANNAKKLFKAPKKFIVPLPDQPEPRPGLQKKYFVLLVEDMNLVSKKRSYHYWQSRITAHFLDYFWRIVTTAGLSDSFYIDNCAWSKDGRVAFVDTEHYHKWPIFYPKLFEHLSPHMKKHWSLLIDQKGPK